eukprot:364849-Chlamydomonas_euryale.AAC.18
MRPGLRRPALPRPIGAARRGHGSTLRRLMSLSFDPWHAATLAEMQGYGLLPPAPRHQGPLVCTAAGHGGIRWRRPHRHTAQRGGWRGPGAEPEILLGRFRAPHGG